MIVAGILTPLENLLTWVLTHLHDTVGLTWAWSIVGLVVIVRMLLVPLTVRQIHSMQNLQAHAPEMKAIGRTRSITRCAGCMFCDIRYDEVSWLAA